MSETTDALMSNTVAQGAAALQAVNTMQSFLASLSDDQKGNGKSAIYGLLRAFGDKLTPDVQGVINHLLNATEEPVAARLVGAALHPATRQMLARMAQARVTEMTEVHVSEWMQRRGGVGVLCPNCNEIHIVGANPISSSDD
jgi:hypothetical protein